LSQLSSEQRTIVLYESPFRLEKTLLQLAGALGPGRKASVSRELSKIHEETIRGTLEEIAGYFGGREVKGEAVIVVAGSESRQEFSKALRFPNP